MAKVYEFLANGFEEVEGLGPVDILRRGGVDVKTVSVTGTPWVETSHGITLKADLTIEEADLSDADMLLLPGGLPGATNLRDHEGVRKALVAQAAKGGRIGAICAAPLVLGSLGLLEGKKATCYPGFEKFMTGATYTGELFTIDGNISQLLSMAWASSAPRWARLAFSVLESWPGMDAAGVPWRRE